MGEIAPVKWIKEFLRETLIEQKICLADTAS